MATSFPLSRMTGWKAGPRPIIGHPWSANDVIMVIGWVAILPHAAASFEHDILVPPVGHLSAGGNFLVASTAVLAELVIAALLARALGAAMRKALQHAIRCWRAQRAGDGNGRRVRFPFSRARRVFSAPALRPYSLQA